MKNQSLKLTWHWAGMVRWVVVMAGTGLAVYMVGEMLALSASHALLFGTAAGWVASTFSLVLWPVETLDWVDE